jgi:hypothetical protein
MATPNHMFRFRSRRRRRRDAEEKDTELSISPHVLTLAAIVTILMLALRGYLSPPSLERMLTAVIQAL